MANDEHRRRSWLGLFVTTLTTAAVAVTAAIVAVGGAAPQAEPATIATVLVLLVAAEFLIIRVRYRTGTLSISLTEAVLAPAFFLLPGEAIVPLVAAALLIEGSVRRIQATKTAFNAAQWTLAAAAGVTVFRATAEGTDPSLRNLAALLMALTAVVLVNFLAVAIVIALDTHRPLDVVASALAPAIVIGWAASSAFGVLLALSGQDAAVALLLFLAPLVILHRSSRGWSAALADRERLAGMNHALATFVGEVDPRDALPRFLAAARDCFSADAVEIILTANDARTIMRTSERESWVQRTDRDPASLAAALVTRGRAVSLSREDREDELAVLLRREAWRDCLAAPMVADGQLLGMLCAYNRSGPEGFEEGELSVLRALAGEAASMIRKADLLDAVLEERRTLSEIITRASDGIMTIDAAGRITTWNPGMEGITLYPAAEMVGSLRLTALRPRDSDGADLMLEQWIDLDDLPQNIQIVDRGGEPRWLSCTSSRVLDPDGAPRMLIIVARDVTKLREVEQLKDDFVATVSHELRTPLTPIRGWAAMLMERGGDLSEDERTIAAESIHRQAEHLERLITNLLEASRIERERGLSRDEVVDAAAACLRSVDEARATDPDRTITFSRSPEPCMALGNETWVERITANLLSNAVKYSPAGSPIEVSVAPDGDAVTVRVTDHGPGIAPRDAEVIFDRFRRLGDHATRAVGGTGLGLYIARQLARSIGATLVVDSEVGGGATFTLGLRDARRVITLG